jgi:DNA repair exonuclease SbcCD nuclease subunit
MSKICILGDTHFGVQNDSYFFLKYSLDYFNNTFFPFLRENNIKHVIHLGDVFDRRKFINMHTLHNIKNNFLIPFYNGEFTLHCILGNHDVYYKNTNKVNSLNELLDGNKIKIYDSPRTVEIEGYMIGFVPWMTKDNYRECSDFIKRNESDYLCGHFEIEGFELSRGFVAEHGISNKDFKSYKRVFSGHYHYKQEKENILYTGTPYQLNFSDVEEPKGIHLFSPKDNKVTFIENTNTIFKEIVYTEQNNIDYSKYENSFVRVIVKKKTDPYKFELFMDSLNSVDTAGITVIEESFFELSNEEFSEESQNTLSLINKEIESIEEIKDKAKLKKIIHDLYVESFSI